MSALLSRFASVRSLGSVSSAAVADYDDELANNPPRSAMIVRPVPTVRAENVRTVERVDSIGRIDVNATKGGSGESIRAAQTGQGAVDEGFASVNRAWYKQTLSYDQARSVVADERGSCLDLVAPVRRFTPIVGEDGAFAVRDCETGGVYRPTENALQQLAGWTETGLTLPKRLIDGDDMDRETLRLVMANGWRKLPEDKNLLLRLKDDGTLRAVLSDQYARVDNGWFLDTLESIIPGGRVSHFRGDGDAVFFNVLIPDSMRQDGDDTSYGAMLACGNSEIGTRKIATLPSVFRWICYNGCIWDAVEGVAYVRKVHRGEISLGELAGEIRENLNRQIPLLPQGIDRLLGLRSIVAPRGLPELAIVGTILDSVTSAQITRPMAGAILDGFRDQRTVSQVSAFDLVNGMTKAAQGFAPATQESVERAAGELMASWNPDRWDAAFREARSFRDSDAKRIFTLDVAAQLSA